MSEELNKILDKFDRTLEGYELDKKCGQISIDSICHLFPSEIIIIKDYIQQKENIIKEVREYIMSELITEWDIENDGYVSGSDLPADAITPILEILEKENKE